MIIKIVLTWSSMLRMCWLVCDFWLIVPNPSGTLVLLQYVCKYCYTSWEASFCGSNVSVILTYQLFCISSLPRQLSHMTTLTEVIWLLQQRCKWIESRSSCIQLKWHKRRFTTHRDHIICCQQHISFCFSTAGHSIKLRSSHVRIRDVVEFDAFQSYI